MHNIFLFGDGIIMKKLINLLLPDPEFRLVGLHPRQTEGVDILMHAAKSGIPVFDTNDINNPNYLNLLRGMEIDLLLSCNEKQIFRKDLIEIPALAALNLHGGALPLQRGGGGLKI
jgi:methionyl-tRNA formyltransferase